MSRHLARMNAPRTWAVRRKGIMFIAKPRGGHPTEHGLPLVVILRDILKYVKNTREARRLVNTEEVLIDGKRVKDVRRNVGLFDVLSIPKIKEHYRVYLSRQGKVAIVKAAEEKIKPAKIIGKRLVDGKVQLNLYDGNNLFGDNSYKVGDTIVLDLPSKKIAHHYKLEKGAIIYMTGGKHLGDIGRIENVTDTGIVCKTKEGDVFLMPKQYAFVIGKEKSVITI